MKTEKKIAGEFARLLGMSESDTVPDSFDGIPIANNQSTRFFGYSYERQPDDIDALWEIFDKALAFTSGTEEKDDKKSGYSISL